MIGRKAVSALHFKISCERSGIVSVIFGVRYLILNPFAVLQNEEK